MEDLLKKFKIIDEACCTNWNTLRELVFDIERGLIEVVSVDTRDDHLFSKIYNADDLKKIDTWSTYDKCHKLNFKYLDDKFMSCSAEIWEGGNFHGERTVLRFTAELKVPIAFISNIEDEIIWTFDDYLEAQYRDFEAKRKADWISECRANLLK